MANHDLINSVQAALENPLAKYIVPAPIFNGMMTLLAVLRDQENRLARLERDARRLRGAGIIAGDDAGPTLGEQLAAHNERIRDAGVL